MRKFRQGDAPTILYSKNGVKLYDFGLNRIIDTDDEDLCNLLLAMGAVEIPPEIPPVPQDLTEVAERINALAGRVTATETALSAKVDRVPGMGLSTVDYSLAAATKLQGLADIRAIGDGLDLAEGELSATGSGSGSGSGSGTGGDVTWADITNKPDNLATTEDVEAKVFVATYNVTTAQEIIAYLDAAKEPFAPMLVKRGADYYTVVTAAKQAENRVIIRSFATLSGEYYMFTYTVTDGVWAGASQGFQYKLVSGTNIKTVGGKSLLGSGDIPISGGVTVDAELNATSTNPVQNQAISSAMNDLAGRVNALETDKVTVTAASIPGGGGGEEVVVSVQEAGDQTGAKVLGVRYFTDGQGGVLGDPALIVGNENFSLGVTVDSALDSASRNPVENRVVNQALADKQDTPAYIVDKPSGSSSQLGNVVQVGTFQDNDGTGYGIYEFYYRTTALPTADATIEYTLLPLLADYNIVDFVDATGVTSNGVFIGNGRTDGTNRLIVQQFSKVRKAVILRAYQDYSAQTALLKIKFIGTKNA